jgi:hypothetical protein
MSVAGSPSSANITRLSTPDTNTQTSAKPNW